LTNFPFKIIDLTHVLRPSIPTWDGGCGFEHRLHKDYDPKGIYKFRTHSIQMSEGIGTHMDAPAHCLPGGKCIADLDINDLVAPCIVIDVSHKAHEHYNVSLDDVSGFEHHHGIIQKGCFVIIRTGWEKFWEKPEKYRNNLVFPCLSQEAAALLLNRGIIGLGIDTLSPDRPDNGYPVHKILLESGKYIVENVANSGGLPPVGSYSLALPIKIQDGTEAPLRLVGLIALK
jgi:kynurenine formamidase